MTSKDSGRISENQPVANANNYFGLQLYKMLAKEGKNVFFSPFSLSTALGMLFYGARNKTMQEMKTVLGYEIANIKNEEIKFFSNNSFLT
ncbi:serpin B4 [Caerostris darwini]|uniref:Serpin B4 n=1 Tax=Caerostris darwini TaxID=1538125 RepID=A0AAV4RT73_9ARAC|nr:serpin B4 [Caerostris darwini]